MVKRSKENVSVGSRVYDILKNNIVKLNLAPGTAMSEQELAEKLQVSRTPVREAFIKLSKEGFVDIIPQKGTFVSKIDYVASNEERFIREAIERTVVELFVREKTTEAVLRMHRSLEKQKQAVEENNYAKFMEYDDQFHRIIFEDMHKMLSYDIALNVGGNYRRIRYLSMLVEDVVQHNYLQHVEIMKAIEDNDVDKTKDLLRAHLRKVMTEKDDIIEAYPEYFITYDSNQEELEIISENNMLRALQPRK